MIENTGSLMLSTPTIPSNKQTSDICMTKNSYDVPTTTKTTVLPTTFTSSRQPTPRPQAQEESTTSLHFLDVSG
jgi:hypothetical protein